MTKNKEVLQVEIDSDTAHAFNRYCKETGADKSVIVNRLLTDAIITYWLSNNSDIK